MKKKIKDLTTKEIQKICKKNKCYSCPILQKDRCALTTYMFYVSRRTANKKVEVEGDE